MTLDSEFFEEVLGQSRVMVILRGFDPNTTVELCSQARAAGVRAVEVPVQSEDAYHALAAAIEWGRTALVEVGAGTVLNPESARRVVDMGAAFTVAPGIDAAVIDECRSLGSPHLPGVATGTEVQRALLLGLTWQKMFPARELGAGWVAAMRGPFPNVSFVATGGVDLENACSFLDAGVAAVSLGSSFAEAPPALVSSLAR